MSNNCVLEVNVITYKDIHLLINPMYLNIAVLFISERWHSDTATISIFNCVCVLMSMLISTLKHVLMSMLGSGIATIFILTRECVCICQ